VSITAGPTDGSPRAAGAAAADASIVLAVVSTASAATEPLGSTRTRALYVARLTTSDVRDAYDGIVALVCVRGPLKQLAGGCSTHEVEGATVVELLCTLEGTYPAVGGWILDERGLIRRHINVYVNGERGGEGTAVGPDDRIEVLPAISGGMTAA
jgi:molybdopterin converting factor small subunit